MKKATVFLLGVAIGVDATCKLAKHHLSTETKKAIGADLGAIQKRVEAKQAASKSKSKAAAASKEADSRAERIRLVSERRQKASRPPPPKAPDKVPPWKSGWGEP